MPADPLAAAKARIAEIRAELLRLADSLSSLEVEKADLEGFVATTERRLAHRQKEVLHNRHGQDSLIDTLNTENTTPGQRLKTTHAAAARLREVDGSIIKAAKRLGYKPTTVRSWYLKGSGARDIPEDAKKRLAQKPYGIPESSWTSADKRALQ